MYLPQELKEQAVQMRRQGYSIKEISALLGIAKSTASLWSRDIVLEELALNRIQQRRIYGREKAALALKRLNRIRKQRVVNQFTPVIDKLFKHLIVDSSMSKLFCSLLY